MRPALLLTIIMLALPAQDVKPPHALRAHVGWVSCLAFSPDGRLLASGGQDMVVRLWDAKRGTERAALHGHTGYIDAVAFTPDGKTLVSGGYDMAIRLWDVASSKARAVLEGHSSIVCSFAFTPEGGLLASGDTGGIVVVWDVATGRARGRIRLWGSIHALAFAPDGRSLAAADSCGSIRLWEVATGQERATLEGDETTSWAALAFTSDCRQLVLAGREPYGTIPAMAVVQHWEAAEGKVLRRERLRDGKGANAFRFADQGRILAWQNGSTVQITDASGGKVYATLEGHEERVTCLALTADVHLLASGDAGGAVKIWDIAKRLPPR